MKKGISLAVASVALLTLVGCGVNEEKINVASAKLDTLEMKGLPDKYLTPVSTNLYKATSDLKRNRGGEAKRAYKVALKNLAAADSIMEASLTDLKPKVVNRFTNLKEEVSTNLTGLHQKEGEKLLDSAKVPLDKDWIFLAQKKVEEGEKRVEVLLLMQDTAKTLTKKVPGTWSLADTAYNSTDPSVNAVHSKKFILKRGGKAVFIDSQKGKEAPTLKQSFTFTSYGTWTLKGSEVHILVDRIKGSERKIEIIKLNLNGSVKEIDRSQSQPAFDSTYTDGSQNRHIPYQLLKEDFRYRR